MDIYLDDLMRGLTFDLMSLTDRWVEGADNADPDPGRGG
jgi:hypothetical protein